MKFLVISIVIAASAPFMIATAANAQTSAGASARQLDVAQVSGAHAGGWQRDGFATATNYPANLALNGLRDDPASDFPRGQAHSSDSGAPGLNR